MDRRLNNLEAEVTMTMDDYDNDTITKMPPSFCGNNQEETIIGEYNAKVCANTMCSRSDFNPCFIN
jgi:hypothetical protein